MKREQCTWLSAMASGFAGALALTAIHESARRVVAHPPRMDTVGRRAIRKSLDFTGGRSRPRAELQRLALLGDLAANTVYYAAVARAGGAARWARALTLGTAAGIGALTRPPYMGLGRPPNSEYGSTRLMTVAWYLAGALAAAAAADALTPSEKAMAA